MHLRERGAISLRQLGVLTARNTEHANVTCKKVRSDRRTESACVSGDERSCGIHDSRVSA